MAELTSRQTVPFYSYFTPTAQSQNVSDTQGPSWMRGKLPGLIDLAGVGASAYANTSAANRSLAERPAGPELKDFLHASYVAGGGAEGRPTNLQRGLPTFGLGPTASTPQQRAFANDLLAELKKRQQKSADGVDAGGWEKTAGILAAAAPYIAMAL